MGSKKKRERGPGGRTKFFINYFLSLDGCIEVQAKNNEEAEKIFDRLVKDKDPVLKEGIFDLDQDDPSDLYDSATLIEIYAERDNEDEDDRKQKVSRREQELLEEIQWSDYETLSAVDKEALKELGIMNPSAHRNWRFPLATGLVLSKKDKEQEALEDKARRAAAEKRYKQELEMARIARGGCTGHVISTLPSRAKIPV